MKSSNSANKARNRARRIFFVDIENYAGKAAIDARDVLAVRTRFNRQFRPDDDDLIVIGSSHGKNFLTASLAWKGPRHLFRPGHNGADLALLDALDQYRFETFGGVYIISGDGIFAEKAAELKARGIDVTMVSRFSSLNRRLLWAAPCLAAA